MDRPTPSPPPEVALQRLRSLRGILLRLHKLLLDWQCDTYQRLHGPVSKGELFQLVLHDPDFAWLRPVSGLIARIDELFASEEPLTAVDAGSLYGEAQELLQPAEGGEGFGRRYFDALQQEPEIILTHAEVSRLMRR